MRDAALHELSELTRCAAQADGRAQGLQEMLEAERRATHREAARADRAEARADRTERRPQHGDERPEATRGAQP
jgi:hypothetical protein